MNEMNKNITIIIYKHRADEFSHTSELFIFTKSKIIRYFEEDSSYGDNSFSNKVTNIDLYSDELSINCFNHLISSFKNSENIIDCDNSSLTNDITINVDVVDEESIPKEILNGVTISEQFNSVNKIKNRFNLNKDYNSKYFSYSLSKLLPEELWPDFVKYNLENVIKDNKDLWEEENTIIKSETTKQIFEYGLYPQTLVEDKKLIAKLNEIVKTPEENAKWNDFGYRVQDYNGGYMFYIDISFESERYRGVYIEQYRPINSTRNLQTEYIYSQKNNGFELGKVYWFKFEAIKWIKLNNKNDYISLNILDAEPMLDKCEKNIDATRIGFYKNTSSLNRWINDNFANKQYNIDLSLIKSNGLLSIEEYQLYLPLKVLRKPRPTDYCLVKGYLFENIRNDSPFVWSSSYLSDEINYERMASISKDGSIIDFYAENYGYIHFTCGGVQPYINIDFYTANNLKNYIVDFKNIPDLSRKLDKIIKINETYQNKFKHKFIGNKESESSRFKVNKEEDNNSDNSEELTF